MQWILPALCEQESQLIEWRRHLPRHRELAFEEVGAAQYVADLLKSCGYEVTTGIILPLFLILSGCLRIVRMMVYKERK